MHHVRVEVLHDRLDVLARDSVDGLVADGGLDHRHHHALGGLLVPAGRYYGRVEEVLARIEAGAGRDAGDLLDLRERCVELFKVTSKAGVAEVWLRGQRLLEPPQGARS